MVQNVFFCPTSTAFTNFSSRKKKKKLISSFQFFSHLLLNGFFQLALKLMVWRFQQTQRCVFSSSSSSLRFFPSCTSMLLVILECWLCEEDNWIFRLNYAFIFFFLFQLQWLSEMLSYPDNFLHLCLIYEWVKWIAFLSRVSSILSHCYNKLKDVFFWCVCLFRNKVRRRRLN